MQVISLKKRFEFERLRREDLDEFSVGLWQCRVSVKPAPLYSRSTH